MDNTGTQFDFTVAADNTETLEWEFSRMNSGAFDVSDATFEAVVKDAAGVPVTAAMLVGHGEQSGLLSVAVKGLPAAVYAYEVWSLSAEGVRSRLLYGCLTAVSSAAALLTVAEASTHPCRVLRVMVPDEVGAPLLLAWRVSSVTAAMAASAERYAESAKNSAESAGAAAQSAEKNAAKAEHAVQGAEEVAGEKVVDGGVVERGVVLGFPTRDLCAYDEGAFLCLRFRQVLALKQAARYGDFGAAAFLLAVCPDEGDPPIGRGLFFVDRDVG